MAVWLTSGYDFGYFECIVGYKNSQRPWLGHYKGLELGLLTDFACIGQWAMSGSSLCN